MQCFQHGFLINGIEIDKWLSVHLLSDFIDASQAEPIGVLVARHAFEPVAVEAVFVQAFVDIIDRRYFVEFVAIVLGQDSVAYSGHQARFFERKKAN